MVPHISSGIRFFCQFLGSLSSSPHPLTLILTPRLGNELINYDKFFYTESIIYDSDSFSTKIFFGENGLRRKWKLLITKQRYSAFTEMKIAGKKGCRKSHEVLYNFGRQNFDYRNSTMWLLVKIIVIKTSKIIRKNIFYTYE
jgi:hypothetical protein